VSKRTERYEDIIKQSPKPSVSNNAKVTATAEEPISSDPIADSAKKADTNGADFLGSLLHAKIFFDYFEYVANRTYKGENLELKIVKLKTVHPYFYNICIILDMVVATVAISILMIVATCALCKIVR
jgi:hypothetical protein